MRLDLHNQANDWSYEFGFEGCVSFEAKSELIDHYQEKFGAQQIGRSQVMIIDEKAAAKLIGKYLKDRDHGNRSGT